MERCHDIDASVSAAALRCACDLAKAEVLKEAGSTAGGRFSIANLILKMYICIHMYIYIHIHVYYIYIYIYIYIIYIYICWRVKVT